MRVKYKMKAFQIILYGQQLLLTLQVVVMSLFGVMLVAQSLRSGRCANPGKFDACVSFFRGTSCIKYELIVYTNRVLFIRFISAATIQIL